MATMNISLPDQMKAWVEAQSADGRDANSSDYVRDLIRREQIKAEKIAHWQRLVDEARAIAAIFSASPTDWKIRITSPSKCTARGSE